MDSVFPENDNENDQDEYTISKSKPVNLHLARMPENFKINLAGDSNSKETTKIDRNLIVKKQKITDGDSKDIVQYVMEDMDEVKKTEDNGSQATRYIGREVVQNQKYLVFYRKDKDIMLCSLSSIISFKKDQQLRSSALESIKSKRGGRQGIKALLRTNARKDEEKEKEKDKDKDGNDDGLSNKSWSDSDDSDSNRNPRKNDTNDMAIKNIFEQEPPEPVAKSTPKGPTNARATADKEPSEHQSAADQKDSDNDTDSSCDFE